jgi:putative tryptophan/tyrosine transport system substrate-binding protein
VGLFTVELVAKRLELISELDPQAHVIALLVNPNYSTTEAIIRDAQEAAHTKGVQLEILKAGSENEIDDNFTRLVERHAGALIIGADPFFASRRQQLVAPAARHAVPTMYFWREFSAIGGLISYAPSIADGYRQAGVYAERILKGAKPADLPVQQPAIFELVVNLATAKVARPHRAALDPRPRRRGHRVRRSSSLPLLLARACANLLDGARSADRALRSAAVTHRSRASFV